MPTKFCNNDPKLIAQTLFLGASVASFNTSMGWGGQPSQLTVNLIEDEFIYSCSPSTDSLYSQFTNADGNAVYDATNFPINHYHTCAGPEYIKCYIDKYTGQSATVNTPIDNRILPGKVYYCLDPTLGLVSKYWRHPDPGFFGRKTRIKHDGTYNTSGENSHPGFKYDIIDTPVYFKMGDFQFGGFIQSWSRNIGNGGKNYTVIVNGAQSILNSSYIILDRYAGSIFSKAAGNSFFGSPKNYLGSEGVDYTISDLHKGVLPNVFNVYGFLESLGEGNFGIAGNNENGISINRVLKALSFLTSTTADSNNKLNSVLTNRNNEAIKRAFSPFGRIISKTMQREDYGALGGNNLYEPITDQFNNHCFGAISPQPFSHLENDTSSKRCQFVLDLNDVLYADSGHTIYRIPDALRINGPVITISELLNQISEQCGIDIYTEMVPVVDAGIIYHVIKVKTISRLKQPRTNVIENTIKQLECDGYTISSNTIGKEKNETSSRCMIVGGQQQRLLQIKSYRLAYSQSNLIYNPSTRKFVNYYSLIAGALLPGDPPVPGNAQYGHGKIRFPNFNNTRNKFVSDAIGTQNSLQSDYISIINDEYQIQLNQNKNFNNPDSSWISNNELGDGISVNYGNYEPSYKISHTNTLSTSDQTGGRWFPLYMDNICPFFGFVNDTQVTVQINENNESNTNFRKIRPVWYDTWTGQINIIVRISELPKLNVPMNKASMEPNYTNSEGKTFPLPSVANLDDPASNTVFDNLGQVNSYQPVEYFVLTESEIRAALAGFDNFLVYSLAKTYKPDLIELLRRAYLIKTKNKLLELGMPDKSAKKVAEQETDWYWKLLGPNIAGDELYPTTMYPDKNDGSQYIQEKALQDLKILHQFVSDIGKYYGRKYMVKAPNLRSYRDENLTGVVFPTNIGYGYVFSGDGNLKYNYTPTNDGAWEEYGNIIDDSMVVGGMEWYTLSDDSGKIKPLLGYNNNAHFDYVRYNKCKAANKPQNILNELKTDAANPYFSYNAWLTLYEYKTRTCDDSFTFPSLDLSSLEPSSYVVVDQKKQSIFNFPQTLPSSNGLSPIVLDTPVYSYDAWNKQLNDPSGSPLPRSKLYVPTSVEENFVFLDPQNLVEPRILIESPGVSLNISSEENAKDPNRTVITNVAAEDLIIYLKTHDRLVWDKDWINMMLNYIAPMVFDDEDNPYFLGVYTISANHTANNVELAPKAAHPFFAGIPIKSNQFTYGPWTNYPLITYQDIYPSGYNITQSSSYPLTCTTGALHQPTIDEATKAINNLITNIDIEIKDDFVPWNYGGMHYLDIVAFKEIQTRINYQSIIETAQLDIPGLPLFDLGGNFALNNIGLSYKVSKRELKYIDIKDAQSSSIVDLSYIPGANTFITAGSTNNSELKYKILDLQSDPNYTEGPIISNIQCAVGQQGIITTYSFRTYTRKLGLFNREEIERIRKINQINNRKNKQISLMSQQVRNLEVNQRKALLEERLNQIQFGSAELSSKLFGWSPSTVLIGQASPLINEPSRSPKYTEDYTFASQPGNLNSNTESVQSWTIPSSDDVGGSVGSLTQDNSSSTLKSLARVTTTVQLFERKEVENQIQKDYGMQSMMSLDGLLSPVSFYPTFKNSTFSFSLHNTNNCPFCDGTKVRKLKLARYTSDGSKEQVGDAQSANNKKVLKITCDKCTYPSKRLNAKIIATDEIPINLITLNPIVVPYGEFKNTNTQNYAGAHPDGKHSDLTSFSASGVFGNSPRTFRDRMRHCIEIIGRGSVPPNRIKYSLETSRNFNAFQSHPEGVSNKNLDYSQHDEALYNMRSKVNDPKNKLYENNQRFFGFRGPMVMHAWGYDDEGYPVPNAADEPYAFDIFGRPMRFKLTLTTATTAKKFKSLSFGDMFKLKNEENAPIYAKTINYQNLPTLENGDNTEVYLVKIQDDLTKPGGYDPGEDNKLTDGYKGSIISKTQKWNGTNKWTEKVKLNEFYLNWAERPDLWKVGPIDLFWDSERMVWSAGKGGEEITPPYIVTNSNDIDTLDQFLAKRSTKNNIYRFIYATLEEDLIKQTDFDETYVSRAFIDDIEFSKEPLLQGYRRLIYIKDKTGYCAPRGTKLLCRYNRYTGFYEPISKPVLTAKGKLISTSQAIIDMHYIQGRKAGVVPTSVVTYDNPLSFNITPNAIGIFTFLNGKWTITSTKQ